MVSTRRIGSQTSATRDAILAAAAAPQVPPALMAQLKRGGRLVIPLGERNGAQTLYLIRKRAEGDIERRPVLQVRFVPFTGGAKRGTVR